MNLPIFAKYLQSLWVLEKFFHWRLLCSFSRIFFSGFVQRYSNFILPANGKRFFKTVVLHVCLNYPAVLASTQKEKFLTTAFFLLGGYVSIFHILIGELDIQSWNFTLQSFEDVINFLLVLAPGNIELERHWTGQRSQTFVWNQWMKCVCRFRRLI